MAFKLGSESRLPKIPGKTKFLNRSSNTPILRKSLEGTTLAEANMDGSITIDPKVRPGSKQERRIIKHELSHIEDIEIGRAAYGDEWVMWENCVYFRKEIDGIPVIDGPNGRWPEGHPNHPWEQKAINAEKL